MKRLLCLMLLSAVGMWESPAWSLDSEPIKRLEEAAAVFSEVMATPDKGIPQDLLENAHCIVIVPEPQDRGLHRWREVWERLPVLPEQERAGLVRAGHRPHRGWKCWLPNRRLFDGLDHVGDE